MKEIKDNAESIKTVIGHYIVTGNTKGAYNLLTALRDSEYECSESECDSCPIVKALIAKDIIGTNITHGQYPTCSDFIEFMSERSER